MFYYGSKDIIAPGGRSTAERSEAGAAAGGTERTASAEYTGGVAAAPKKQHKKYRAEVERLQILQANVKIIAFKLNNCLILLLRGMGHILYC